MRSPIERTTIAIACLLPALVAFRVANTQIELQPESRLWVTGTSTVRGFECKAASIDADVKSTVPSAAAAVLAGEKAIGSVEVRVSAAKLDCANGTMNDHMRKALKATEHPTIVFKLSSYDLVRGEQGTQVKMAGTLDLGGVQKPVAITANAEQGANGMLHVSGSYDLKMTEYGIKPPSLMLGTMKVGERVKVGFDLMLKD